MARSTKARAMPSAYFLLESGANSQLHDILTRRGILRLFATTDYCRPATIYELTNAGLRLANAQGWRVERSNSGTPDALEIPLGSFAVVHESLVETKKGFEPTNVRFKFWFRANKKVPQLLSLAPSSAWGPVGIEGGSDVWIGEAGRLLSGTLSIVNDGRSWVVQDEAPQRPIPIC